MLEQFGKDLLDLVSNRSVCKICVDETVKHVSFPFSSVYSVQFSCGYK